MTASAPDSPRGPASAVPPKDPGHWLFRFSPSEWLRLATGELRRAEDAFARRDARGGLASARRAAGMALNGALVLHPDLPWGRSYVDHVTALARDGSEAPPAVRAACQALLSAQPPRSGEPVALGSRPRDARVLEAARDVVAHGYALVVRGGGLDVPDPDAARAPEAGDSVEGPR